MTTIIKPQNILSFKDIKEVWQFRELLIFFAWRDLKVRYKQTFIGIAWAVFQPLVSMIIFSVFLGKFIQIPTENIPYPIFIFIGLLIWQFFSSALLDASNSLVNNQAMITKIYFPRLLLPISTVLTRLIDFCIALIVLVGMMFYYHYTPSLSGILLLPVLLLITSIGAIGGGFFLASLNVKYRDVRHALPFFIQMLMFITPVLYPISLAGKYSWILALNPMVGIINSARAGILGNMAIDWQMLGVSFIVCFIILLIGIIYFKKTERYFADII